MMNLNTPPYTLVKTQPDLQRMAADFADEDALGVDLEADSLFHYQEKICLIQISTRLQNFLIDTLAVGDLSPLAPIMANPAIQKVLHGADYDIRSMHRDFGFEVHSLFDTQIAARFCGLKETGLASLLKDMLGIVLEKKYQKKDWSKRPLPKEMLDYAVHDSCHLLSLARMLEDELRKRTLLFCVEEECEILSNVRAVPDERDLLFLKFKGAGGLDARSLAVLEAVLRFRDKMAVKRDRPLFKVLGNGPIMELVKKKPVVESDLRGIKGLSPKQIKSMGRGLLKNIQGAMNIPEDELKAYPRKTRQRLNPKAAKRVKALKQWREKLAEKLEIDPSLICTNAQIQALAITHPKEVKDFDKVLGLRKWQIKIFGGEICSLLS